MPQNRPPTFSISIVSHGHKEMMFSLLDDLKKIGRQDLEIILTWNLIRESAPIPASEFPFRIVSITNQNPKGFGANHNAAFKKSSGENFVVLNPDIRLPDDPFITILDTLSDTPNCICAPIIVDGDNLPEDSARLFPTPWFLGKKAAAKFFGVTLSPPDLRANGHLFFPDWIAGMFMVVPNTVFSELGGFSDKYFLYYEDVDLCLRARLKNIEILVNSKAKAIHNAQRESHRNLRFFAWHLQSAIRFFTSRPYLAYQMKYLTGKAKKNRNF